MGRPPGRASYSITVWSYYGSISSPRARRPACHRRGGAVAAERLAVRLIVIALVAAILLRLLRRHRNPTRRRRHPDRAALGVPVIDPAVLRPVVATGLAFTLRVLVLIVQVVQCRGSHQDGDLLSP